MADPIQPMAGSQLYNQVQDQLNSGGHQPQYSGGAFPGGATMGGGSVGVGGFNMPQLSTMGAATQMGQSNPFGGGASSPFGGGDGIGGAGDSIKKLVDTNKDLIAALKDLTKGIKSIGGGGPGGMPGMGGMGGGGGGGFGDSGLSNKLLSNIARGKGGMIDLAPTIDSAGFATPGGQALVDQSFGHVQGMEALADPFTGAAPPAQIYRGGAFQPNPAFQQYQQHMTANRNINDAHDILSPMGGGPGIYTEGGRLQAPGRFSAASIGQGLSNFGNGLLGRPQQMTAGYQRATRAQAHQGIRDSGFSQGAQDAATDALMQNEGTDANLPEEKGSFGKAAGKFAHGAGRVIGAGGTNMSEIVSQIPYVGGIMSAPLNVLEGRLQGAMVGELPGIIHSGFGQGKAQGSGHINTHSGFLKTMRNNLGLGAADALNMGNEVLNAAGGQQIANLGGKMTAAIANGMNVGDVGVNASFGRAGMNLQGTGLTGTSSIRMAKGMGLKGQAASDFLGAVAGLGSQFGAMGIDLGDKGQTARDISDIHRSGFSSLKGKLAVEGFSRMRQKGGIAASQGLGGLFGGVGTSLLMADALDRSDGDFDKAGQDLEQLSPFENRSRLASILGVGEKDPVVQMMMMGQGLSYAERHIKRTQKDQISADFKGGAQADAIFTRKQAKLDADRLTNSYGANRNNIQEMMRINKKIEDKLISGVTVKDMEGLVSLVADISNVANNLATNLASIINAIPTIINVLKNLNPFGPSAPPGTPPSAPSDERLKKDIVLIDVSEEGYNIYEFVYIDDEDATVYQGVMAQEVIKVKPEAVYVDQRGYYGVHYNLIDVEFRKVV